MNLTSRFLFICLCVILSKPIFSAEENFDGVLEQVKSTAKYLPNKTHPNLPTQGDVISLEESLGFQLPECLKQFHLRCGNLSFKVEFPTIHNNATGKEKYYSDLLDFIDEGYRIGIPENLIPFCHYGDYVCIDPQTNEIQYFTKQKLFAKQIPQPFSAWLKETLLPK